MGDAAAQSFSGNVRSICEKLQKATPVAMRNHGAEILGLAVPLDIRRELREEFVHRDLYAKCLVGLGALVDKALSTAPRVDLIATEGPSLPVEDGLKTVAERIAILERLLELAEWFRVGSVPWTVWWASVAGTVTSPDPIRTKPVESTINPLGNESLSVHLQRLSNAMEAAEPYQKAAEAMRTAWKAGSQAAEIQKEVDRRDSIAECLAPLKSLGSLCEAIAREAIDGLSDRISTILKRIHLTEQLQFQSARLERKQRMVVRGEFSPGIRIDATQVANTSWVRAVLWAFLFALREEAVEQHGSDPFPLLVFDDPQSTFDAQHRHMWAQYVVSLQGKPSTIQLILTTHDDNFLGLIKVDGITGRQALISAPSPNGKHVEIYEGEELNREWEKACKVNSPSAGVSYMKSVRIYVEGVLKLMLRGQDADIPSLVIGQLRDRIWGYHQAQRPPWNQNPFKKLVATLDKGRPGVKFIEGSHHTTGKSYGMGEAGTVEEFWRTDLRPAIERGYRTVREHRLVHGGSSALYGSRPIAHLPEGYQQRVRDIPLRILGRAAALSDGLIADGKVDIDHFSAGSATSVSLGKHFAYRLGAATLDPVARPGDIVLVKEHGEPSNRSLVVAISDERILARRFEIAENHTDIAVLTAQAINPRGIAAPVIANRTTFKLHKIVGVLYDQGARKFPSSLDIEVCDCGGEAALRKFSVDTLGLVEVVGQSAEPYALDGQYLIIGNPVSPRDAVESLRGHPIIAADTDGNTYFKRLRYLAGGRIVLESLESSGSYDPVLLSPLGSGGTSLEMVWQVAGVLFERP